MARGNLLTLLTTSFIALAMSACGGGTPSADTPADDVADAAGDGSEAAVPEKPKDGIVRDADGDGVPDDTGSGCSGKNETQCKINADCAWTDDGQCVEAKASPM